MGGITLRQQSEMVDKVVNILEDGSSIKELFRTDAGIKGVERYYNYTINLNNGNIVVFRYRGCFNDSGIIFHAAKVIRGSRKIKLDDPILTSRLKKAFDEALDKQDIPEDHVFDMDWFFK